MNALAYTRWILVPLVAVTLSACETQAPRPSLYPNAHLKQAGNAVAQGDIDHCMADAQAYGVRKHRNGQVTEKAAKGAAVGGVSVGVYDLVRKGRLTERTLASAAAGAATGATVGAIDSQKIDPVFRNFVNQCLRDKGYRVIGWQ